MFSSSFQSLEGKNQRVLPLAIVCTLVHGTSRPLNAVANFAKLATFCANEHIGLIIVIGLLKFKVIT